MTDMTLQYQSCLKEYLAYVLEYKYDGVIRPFANIRHFCGVYQQGLYFFIDTNDTNPIYKVPTIHDATLSVSQGSGTLMDFTRLCNSFSDPLESTDVCLMDSQIYYYLLTCGLLTPFDGIYTSKTLLKASELVDIIKGVITTKLGNKSSINVFESVLGDDHDNLMVDLILTGDKLLVDARDYYSEYWLLSILSILGILELEQRYPMNHTFQGSDVVREFPSILIDPINSQLDKIEYMYQNPMDDRYYEDLNTSSSAILTTLLTTTMSSLEYYTLLFELYQNIHHRLFVLMETLIPHVNSPTALDLDPRTLGVYKNLSQLCESLIYTKHYLTLLNQS